MQTDPLKVYTVECFSQMKYICLNTCGLVRFFHKSTKYWEVNIKPNIKHWTFKTNIALLRLVIIMESNEILVLILIESGSNYFK